MPAADTVATDTVPASRSVVASSCPSGLNAALGNANKLAAGKADTGEGAPSGAIVATVVPLGSANAIRSATGVRTGLMIAFTVAG
jgi:hypothetical protein